MLPEPTERTVSIYALINPLNNQIFYIGASVDVEARVFQHIYTSRYGWDAGITKDRSDVIRSILKSGNEIDVLILEECTLTNAAYWETFYIDLYKSYGFNLIQHKNMPYFIKELKPKKDRLKNLAKHF